ncbi:hypothetical protein BDQ12DRAFT_471790 [Crucibulum laeve]|uniref:Fungal-type protein kinase domain-containing protein n=1 Tax=Crucibulum laeve TaxID=68775 RepID=A0A5C3LJP6_9AGAR|nr:hypothetical protein BDQ12DRAFT_471790 [Crucibulum laeve]
MWSLQFITGFTFPLLRLFLSPLFVMHDDDSMMAGRAIILSVWLDFFEDPARSGKYCLLNGTYNSLAMTFMNPSWFRQPKSDLSSRYENLRHALNLLVSDWYVFLEKASPCSSEIADYFRHIHDSDEFDDVRKFPTARQEKAGKAAVGYLLRSSQYYDKLFRVQRVDAEEKWKQASWSYWLQLKKETLLMRSIDS